MNRNYLKSFSCSAFIALAIMSCTGGKESHENKEMSIQQRRQFERSDNQVIEKKIDELLSQMTIEEKIGQMMQINSSAIVTESNWGAGSDLKIVLNVDTAKLDNIFRTYHVGSFLN